MAYPQTAYERAAEPQLAAVRLGNIDLLRFFAALMVVLYHYAYTGHASNGLNPMAFPELLPLTQHRWVGAWLFFMISGFGIAYAARRGSAYDFLVARFARIYPVFLFCMCLTSVVLLAAAPQNFAEFQITLPRWLANLTMAPMLMKQGFVDGVYWSILVEVTFYGWVSLFLALGIFHSRQMLILGIWTAISIANEFGMESVLLNKVFLTRNACFFVLGMLSYRVFAANRKPGLAEIMLGLVSVGMALKSDHSVNSWLNTNLDYAAQWNAFYALIKVLVFLALINAAVRVAPLVAASRSSLLGSLSYPLYLLHSCIGFVLFHHLDGIANRWVALVMIYCVALALAFAVARLVEPAGRAFVFSRAEDLLAIKASLSERFGKALRPSHKHGQVAA